MSEHTTPSIAALSVRLAVPINSLWTGPLTHLFVTPIEFPALS